jgi:bifunctional DNA-binding transcriptional regulator/antitoxin component of YhaV-PrlF toxin-antitoxin module
MVMVRFKVKANPVGQVYFPKELREELGESFELVANAKTAVLFPENTPLELVLKSLEVIRLDLKNRLEFEQTSLDAHKKGG